MTTELKNLKLTCKIASGAFGEIHEALSTDTNTIVAVKVEKRAQYGQLKHEYLVYKELKSSQMPVIYDYGKLLYNSMYTNALVMEKLGMSLEQLFVAQNRRFSYKTVLMLVEMMLSRIEFVHHRNYVHRDIKPDNFVFDTQKKFLFLIDYGLAKEYRNPTTFKHREMRTDKSLTGTARYASLRTHKGIEQSRRDDLESMGYCLVYFLKGGLPWQGLNAETKQKKYDKIKECKDNTPVCELCAELPGEIQAFMFYVTNLGYEDMPNYSYLRNLFSEAMRRGGWRNDDRFDWDDEK